MTAIVALLDANTFDTADALFKKSRDDTGQYRRRRQWSVVRHVLPATGCGAAGCRPDRCAGAFGAALRAGLDGVLARGNAELDDETMYDALAPALDAYDAAADDGIEVALAAAASAGRDRVTPLVAPKGRASYLGERSADHQDPGATSATLLLESAAATLL